MQAYQKRLAEMQALGASLITISPQTPNNSLSLAEKHALTFEVLSDADNRVARQYKLVFALPDILRKVYMQIGIDLPKFNGTEAWELPIPGTFVIAKDGTIRLAYVDADYTHRLEPSAIIESLRAIAGQQ